jgi:hypothetical protein
MTAEPHARFYSVDQIGGETLVEQWDPERQFVGALLWQDVATAASLLAVVPDDAIIDPLTRWVYELIRSLTEVGRRPDPAAILYRAQSQPAARALRPGEPPSAREYHRLATHLAALYTQVHDPSAAADYARDILDAAYRQAVRTAARQLQYLSDTCADGADLAARVGATCAALANPSSSRFGSVESRARRS